MARDKATKAPKAKTDAKASEKAKRKAKQNDKVQTYGRKKHAIAVASCFPGRGQIRVNGVPLSILHPEPLRLKLQEPILLVGRDKFTRLDFRVRVRGGGQTSQVYAVRQAVAKALVAYHQKHSDFVTKMDIKRKYLAYDKRMLIADPRMREPKKFGGHGARARRAKSYR